MGNVCIFSGNNAKFLKQNLDLNGQVSILSGTTDPSAVATSAPVGSLYLNTSSGTLYRKTDSGLSTNWVVNTTDVTLSAFGSSPSANGATLSGQAITLQPADATHPGGVSTTTQTLAGDKTFSGTTAFGGIVTNIGDGGPSTYTGTRFSNDSSAASMNLRKSRGSFASPTTVVSNDFIAAMNFSGWNGSAFQPGSSITSTVDPTGTVSSSSMPGKLFFNVSPDGTNIPDVALSIGQNKLTTFFGTINLNTLTASTPLQLDSSKNIVSSAIDLSGAQATGTLAAGRFPALTGDVTTSAGSVATTVAKIAGTTVSGTTGSTNVVFSTSPVITTPTISRITSATANPASIGYLRLAKTDTINWRNNANNGDTTLGKDTNDALTWSGNAIADSNGIIAAAAFPALTGDITSAGGTFATTAAATQNNITSIPNLATIGTITSGTWSAGTIQVNKGGTGVTSVTTSPTATAFAGWDAQKNLSADSFIDGYTTTATAAGTTTLTVDSTKQQFFTGTSTQTCQLPVTSTLVLGQSYKIVNISTGAVTITSSGGNTVQVLPSNTACDVTCILTSGTTAASWTALVYSIIGGASGPTQQRFTSGSGTYTTPTNPTPLYIRVKMIGGGGGGGASGSAGSPTAATDGGDTTFGSSLLTASKGTKAIFQGANGSGGSATINSPAFGSALTGGGGSIGGCSNSTATASQTMGAPGTGTPFGGGGQAGGASGGGGSAAGHQASNTGAGGAGAGHGTTTSTFGGSSGGAGGFIDAIIINPSTTYTYAVGTAGTGGAAGTNGFAGGNGGSGYIEVTEYYPQFLTGSGNYTVDTFTGDNSTVVFTLTAAPSSVNNTQVYISGVYQQKSTYTVAGTTITFSTAPPTGSSNIQVVTGLAIAIGTPGDGTVTYAKLNSGTLVVPTQQRFTSGTAQTYTTPTSPRSPLYIKVRMVGGGGGGGGSGTTTGTNGTAGGNTTFGTSLLVANGGGFGNQGAGGVGGTASITGPAFGTSFSGGNGSRGHGGISVVTVVEDGAAGASSPFGGAGAGSDTTAGGDAVANTGSGGGGGGVVGNAGGAAVGASGGAGGYVDAIISSPSSTYTYTVGTAGTASAAGTNGFAGGAGSAGYIEVTEYYQ